MKMVYFTCGGKVKTYVATAIANIKLPSKTSDLTNDSGFITAKDVPEGAAASSTVPKMDGTVLGFGPTQSGLTIRAGRDPLVLVQLLLLTLPLVFK